MMCAARPLTYPAVETDAYCPCCGCVKPLESFGPDERKLNGRRTLCRPCEAAQKRRIRMITALRVTFAREW